MSEPTGECVHVWRPLGSPVRRMDGWGYWHRVLEWYCERCRKTEWRALD